LKKKFIAFLAQGLSPEKLALCVALGCVIGVFPALGWTTLLCALAAWTLRLNQPAIQSVNYVVYPLQFILLIPFYRMGERLFNAPKLAITGQGVKDLITSGLWNAIHVLWTTTMHAIVAWALAAPLAAGSIYLILVPLFRRVKR
jgi:uncharacterized protein (DUF2062 family)